MGSRFDEFAEETFYRQGESAPKNIEVDPLEQQARMEIVEKFADLNLKYPLGVHFVFSAGIMDVLRRNNRDLAWYDSLELDDKEATVIAEKMIAGHKAYNVTTTRMSSATEPHPHMLDQIKSLFIGEGINIKGSIVRLIESLSPGILGRERYKYSSDDDEFQDANTALIKKLLTQDDAKEVLRRCQPVWEFISHLSQDDNQLKKLATTYRESMRGGNKTPKNSQAIKDQIKGYVFEKLKENFSSQFGDNELGQFVFSG